MSESPLRVGIIGAGHIASVHARHLVRVPGARLTAIVDLHPEKATAFAEASGAAVYDTLEALLQADAVDALIVATPTETHAEVTVQALQAGKHVLCEKPLTLTAEEGARMVSAAKVSGKQLITGQVVRFFPEYASAKNLVESGAVGKPAAVRAKRCVGRRATTDKWHTDPAGWYADPNRGGGVLYDLLTHEFDWLLWCFGPIERVYAHALTPRLFRQEIALDYALVTLRHRGGTIAHVEGFWGDPNGFSTAFEIAGDGGLLTHDSRKVGTLRKGAIPVSPLVPTDDPYYRQLVAFMEACRTGSSASATGEEGLHAALVARAAVESATTGRAVTLPDGAGNGEYV